MLLLDFVSQSFVDVRLYVLYVIIILFYDYLEQ